MASIIKSNTYADFNGREILTANNDGALTTQKINYPMFQVYRNADLVISDITNTQVTYTTVDYDTNSGWDSTNNKYVIPTGMGGKYYISNALMTTSGAANQLSNIALYIRINNTVISRSQFNYENNHGRQMNPFTGIIYDCSAGDEIDAMVWINVTSGSPTIQGSSGERRTYLSAYRIGS